VRIKTAVALRQVDRWKEMVTMRYRRYIGSLSFLLISVGFSRQLLVPTFFTLGLSLSFAFLELASLLVLGAFLVKLHSYRFANIILRATSWASTS